MGQKVTTAETQKLFGMLADIEVLHQERLIRLYAEITGTEISREEFRRRVVSPAMEGGLTTEEYLQLYRTDLGSEIEILGVALAIEAQALDLYARAAQRSSDHASREVLLQIADEERSHIAKLSEYIDQHQDLR